MMSGPAISDQAALLAQQGRVPEALLLLNSAAARGDAEAMVELGKWRLVGNLVPRDLAASRDWFRRAAEAGHKEASRVYNAFLANGTGGAAKWLDAVAMLRRRATADPEAAQQLAAIEKMDLTPGGDPVEITAGRMLSTSPHVEVFPTLLTPAECRFLAKAAEPLMQAALTVNPQTGQQLRNPIRTSDAAGFPLALENPAIHAINRRLAAVSKTPVSHGEPLQVLRYRPGQQYRAHSDALPGVDNQRVVTVLVYLNDGYSGGETHFLANKLSFKGGLGDALLFRNVKPDGRADEQSAHAGLPVKKGVKLIASRWIRQQPLSLEPSRR
jgi:prolyl 4-hydroxylase